MRYKIAFGVIGGVAAFLGLFQIIDYPKVIDLFFVSFFLAIWLFTGGIHAKGMYDRDQIDGFLLWVYMPLVVLVVLVDVVFNAVYGTIIYRELPQEWLFTTRTKRHLVSSSGRNRTAQIWADRLNYIDPGHI